MQLRPCRFPIRRPGDEGPDHLYFKSHPVPSHRSLLCRLGLHRWKPWRDPARCHVAEHEHAVCTRPGCGVERVSLTEDEVTLLCLQPKLPGPIPPSSGTPGEDEVF